MRIIFMALCCSLIYLLGSCDITDSPAVTMCKNLCESSSTLQQLQKKVVYKPIKHCKRRCSATEGTCMEREGTVMRHAACVFYGVNAGSMKPRKSLNPF